MEILDKVKNCSRKRRKSRRTFFGFHSIISTTSTTGFGKKRKNIYRDLACRNRVKRRKVLLDAKSEKVRLQTATRTKMAHSFRLPAQRLRLNYLN